MDEIDQVFTKISKPTPVTYRARDQFLVAHPGKGQDAEIQIQEFAEDLMSGRWTVRYVCSYDGYHRFHMENISLVFSPDCSVVIEYVTRHKFRTWREIKAGVPSPVAKKRSERETLKRKERRPLARARNLIREIEESGGSAEIDADGKILTVAGPAGACEIVIGHLGSKSQKARQLTGIAAATGLMLFIEVDV